MQISLSLSLSLCLSVSHSLSLSFIIYVFNLEVLYKLYAGLRKINLYVTNCIEVHLCVRTYVCSHRCVDSLIVPVIRDLSTSGVINPQYGNAIFSLNSVIGHHYFVVQLSLPILRRRY